VELLDLSVRRIKLLQCVNRMVRECLIIIFKKFGF